MLTSAQNCQKYTFLDNLRIITQEGNMQTRQMTPFFSSTFCNLTVCNIHFWIWKYWKFVFMWSPLRSILACKISKYLVRTYQFREFVTFFYRHPEVTKNLYYVLYIRRSQIPIFLGSWTIINQLYLSSHLLSLVVTSSHL